MEKQEILKFIQKNFKDFYNARIYLLMNDWGKETYLKEEIDEKVGNKLYKVKEIEDNEKIILLIQDESDKTKAKQVLYEKGELK